MPPRFCVAIDSSDAYPGKAFAQELFNLFGAFAHVIDVFAPARGTLGRRTLVVIAVMTNQGPIAAMISQCNFAIRTHDRLAARAAKNETRVAAPVEQDDRLL